MDRLPTFWTQVVSSTFPPWPSCSSRVPFFLRLSPFEIYFATLNWSAVENWVKMVVSFRVTGCQNDLKERWHAFVVVFTELILWDRLRVFSHLLLILSWGMVHNATETWAPRGLHKGAPDISLFNSWKWHYYLQSSLDHRQCEWRKRIAENHGASRIEVLPASQEATM